MPYVNQVTLEYTTFIKRALTEAMQDALNSYQDPTINSVKAAVDFTFDRFTLPAIIMRYSDQTINNIGVGHYEILPVNNVSSPSQYITYYHRLYNGTVTFDIYTLSSVDRDLLRDLIIEILGMTNSLPAPEGNAFTQRFYWYLNQTPYGLWHFPVLNLDLISGSGESEETSPFYAEDQMVYRYAYQVPIMGEFYSVTPANPDLNTSTLIIDEVILYPQMAGYDPAPGSEPSSMDYTFSGWSANTIFF
jgi:hypothetical protein